MSLGTRNTKFYATKRGDTIIEVMFAIAVFCLVAVISISMMNRGVAQAESSLEVVTARNEINAQAEALRFIHSSYIAERTLPKYGDIKVPGEKYQIYTNLWKDITEHAISLDKMKELGGIDMSNLGEAVVQPKPDNSKIRGCSRLYDEGILEARNAFILNTRNLQAINDSTHQVDISTSLKTIEKNTDSNIFRESPLNARVIFKNDATSESTDPDVQYFNQSLHNELAWAEGIWIIAVSGKTDKADDASTAEYYDFYIQSCWNGPTGNTPQSIDTIIRLYNPEGM